jgi:hypothetical protein
MRNFFVFLMFVSLLLPCFAQEGVSLTDREGKVTVITPSPEKHSPTGKTKTEKMVLGICQQHQNHILLQAYYGDRSAADFLNNLTAAHPKTPAELQQFLTTQAEKAKMLPLYQELRDILTAPEYRNAEVMEQSVLRLALVRTMREHTQGKVRTSDLSGSLYGLILLHPAFLPQSALQEFVQFQRKHYGHLPEFLMLEAISQH